MSFDLDLSVQVGRIKFGHPVILASGVLNETADSMKRVIRSGAAGVVTKSISLNERDGYINPTFVELPFGFLNSMGIPNPGIEEYSKEVINLAKFYPEKPIILSLYGENTNEFEELSRRARYLPVQAVEVNLSCPNINEGGLAFGVNPDMVKEVIKAVKRGFPRDVWAKISAQVSDVRKIALSAQRAGADAIVAINTLKGMKIDLETAMPVLYHKSGGYSGPAIKPIALNVVWEIATSKEIYLPVIGVGGITTGKDAVEFFLAGASLVEVGSAVSIRGIEVFRRIKDEIVEFLIAHGYNSVREIVGLSVDQRSTSVEEVTS